MYRKLIISTTVAAAIVTTAYACRYGIEQNEKMLNCALQVERKSKFPIYTKLSYKFFGPNYKYGVHDSHLSQLDDNIMIKMGCNIYCEQQSIPTKTLWNSDEPVKEDKDKCALLLEKINSISIEKFCTYDSNYMQNRDFHKLFWNHGTKSLFLINFEDTDLLAITILDCVNQQLKHRQSKYGKGDNMKKLVEDLKSLEYSMDLTYLQNWYTDAIHGYFSLDFLYEIYKEKSIGTTWGTQSADGTYSFDPYDIVGVPEIWEHLRE